MKRILNVILILIIFIPFGIKAYGIDNYFIDATIEKNGDLLVEEYFNLTGKYNGFERIINYRNDDAYQFDPNMTSFGGSSIHNGTDIEIIEVGSVAIDDNIEFKNLQIDKFKLSSNPKTGKYGLYKIERNEDGKNIFIYNPDRYNKAFYIKYRIKNLAIKHNDVAELGWNIVGNELRESVGFLKLYLHIPGNTNIKAWAHGPLNGNVEIINNETILVTIGGLNSYRAIDVRTTFDLDVINESYKKTNIDALDKILLYEEDKAEQANYERKNEEKLKIQEAEYYLAKFETNVTRFYYEYALEKINLISDIEVKKNFIERLNPIKTILDSEEEETAKNSVQYALETLEYKYYEDALENVEILDNQEIKHQLKQKLEIILEKIKENEKKLEKNNIIFGIVIFLITSIIGYLIYIFYRKDPKAIFNKTYLRDFPSNASPEIVSYLFNKKITNNAISASMMDLIRKKIILVEKIDTNNYKLTRNSEYNQELTELENKLIILIFQNKKEIYTKDMKATAKRKYNSFINRWEDYIDTSLEYGKAEEFYESDNMLEPKKNTAAKTGCMFYILLIIMSLIPPIIIIIVPGLIIYFIYRIFKFIRQRIINQNGQTDYKKLAMIFLNIFLSLVSFIKIIYILLNQSIYRGSIVIFVIIIIVQIYLILLIDNKKKKTIKGVEEYNKWNAVKNFLNDFGKFNDKDVYDISLWEKYLVYATLFGCAKTVLQHMKLELVNDPNGCFENYLELYNMNRYITSTLVKSNNIAHTTKNANDISSSSGNYSSGSGGGGGFSSGGGSFGGGGGGGRF